MWLTERREQIEASVVRTQKGRFRVHCEWNQTGEISCGGKGFSSRRDIPGTRTCCLGDLRSLTKGRHEGFLDRGSQ